MDCVSVAAPTIGNGPGDVNTRRRQIKSQQIICFTKFCLLLSGYATDANSPMELGY